MITIQTILPHPALRPYVQRYWVLRQDADVPFSKMLLPTGYTKWMFHRKTPFRTGRSGANNSQVFACGPYQHSLTVSCDHSFEMITVLFQFHAASLLTGIPSICLTDNAVDFNDMEDILLYDLKSRVLDATSTSQAIGYIEEHLLSRLSRIPFSPYLRPLGTIMQHLEQSPDCTIPMLAQKACMSERQFRRVFHETIGLSPKQFVRLRKFVAAASYLTTQIQPVKESVLRFDYTDHSHLDKEFHYFAGITPTDYINYIRSIDDQRDLAALQSYYSNNE